MMMLKHSKVLLLGIVLALTAAQVVDAESQRDVVGYWKFELNPGFNLIAFPLLPETPSPRAVFSDIQTDIEITTWDRHLRSYRWTRYNARTDLWTGNLFLLDRGVAYWINVMNAGEPQEIVVTGHPELYRKFRWEQMDAGWNFYAPMFGREQSLDDLRPDNSNDLLLSWNVEDSRFNMAEASPERYWFVDDFNAIAPDRSYLVFLNSRKLRPVGPPVRREYGYDGDFSGKDNNRSISSDFDEYGVNEMPPRPLIVSNSDGLPVCRQNGDVCSGGFTLHVVREGMRVGADGEQVPDPETVSRHFIPVGRAVGGYFRLALTVGGEAGQLRNGDRIYLLAVQNSAETRSTSFEVNDDVWLFDDLSFPDPMASPGELPVTPIAFTLSKPYPNPFNQRFQVEFSLPETAPVRYTIYDLQGRAVQSTSQPFSAGTHRLSISGQNLSAGVYLFEVVYNQQRKYVKVAYVR